MKKISKIGETLMKLLLAIDDSKDFVVGVMCNANNDQAWQKIIDFIEYAKAVDDKVTKEQILKLSIYLSTKHPE